MTTTLRLPRNYSTTTAHRERAKRRRDELIAAKWCLNGKHHGPATHGVRCEHCATLHRT